MDPYGIIQEPLCVRPVSSELHPNVWVEVLTPELLVLSAPNSVGATLSQISGGQAPQWPGAWHAAFHTMPCTLLVASVNTSPGAFRRGSAPLLVMQCVLRQRWLRELQVEEGGGKQNNYIYIYKHLGYIRGGDIVVWWLYVTIVVYYIYYIHPGGHVGSNMAFGPFWGSSSIPLSSTRGVTTSSAGLRPLWSCAELQFQVSRSHAVGMTRPPKAAARGVLASLTLLRRGHFHM